MSWSGTALTAAFSMPHRSSVAVVLKPRPFPGDGFFVLDRRQGLPRIGPIQNGKFRFHTHRDRKIQRLPHAPFAVALNQQWDDDGTALAGSRIQPFRQHQPPFVALPDDLRYILQGTRYALDDADVIGQGEDDLRILVIVKERLWKLRIVERRRRNERPRQTQVHLLSGFHRHVCNLPVRRNLSDRYRSVFAIIRFRRFKKELSGLEATSTDVLS